MKKLLFMILLLVSISSFGCQWAAKKMGGTITIDLPANTELVNITWKDSDIWYLTRPRHAGETIDTLRFNEQSSVGLVEGLVIINER